MKRLFLPFMMLCLLFVGKAQAQEELTVCDGTSTSSYVPVYGLWMDDYTRCEMIYPAEMIDDMTNGMITSLTFYISSPASAAWSGNEFNVYLMEVDATTLSAYYGSTNAEVVYSGTLDGQGQTMTIEFDDAYMYSGGNLLVGIEEPVASTYKSCSFYGVEATGASASGYSSSSLDAVTFNERNFLPKVTFAYEAGSVDCAKPKNIVFSGITAHEVNVSWTAGGSETMWLVGIMAVDDSTDYQGNYTSTPSYSFSNLQGERQYQVGVVAVCDVQSQLISEPRYAYFTTEVSCQKPQTIVAEAGSHDATITWALTAFTGGFYDFEDGVLPTGWTSEGAAQWSVGTGDYSATTGAASGTKNARITHGVSGNETYLVTQPLDLSNDASGVVSLSYINRMWVSDIDGFGVYYRVNGGAWNELFATTESHDTWTQLSLPLPAEALVANCQIGFKFTDGYGYGVGVDAVAIGQPIEPDFPFNFRYRAQGTNEWTYVNNIEGMTTSITGLDAETTYEMEVQSVCGGEDGESAWTSGTFTTDIACPQPTNLQVVPATSSAVVTWESDAPEFNLCYRPVDMSDMATIILTAPDIWQDGSGYQMLLDADATAYGTIIPETGALTTGGDVPASIYDEFEYKIPVNADGALATQNIVINNSIEIQVPAGVYDWCITNPTPGDRMWIAASNGNVGGRQDNYEFLVGQTYEFTISMYGSNDGVDVTIGGKNRTKSREFEWECIDGITDNNYTLEGLDADTKYQVRVQAVCGGIDGESEWTGGTFITLPTCPRPTAVTVSNITGHEATVTWTAGGEETLWNVILGNEVYEADETTFTLTGLDPETEYTVEVISICNADDSSQPATATFTTDIACPVPTGVSVSNIAETTAVVTWNGSANEYVVCYRPIDPNDGANVTLTAPDIWGDGSGYQMLLDANANAFGTIIPETGPLTSSGNADAATYAEFEYKIPENADGNLSTSNIVMNSSVTVTIPGGVYDWCITNPTPGDRMWIAASNGNVGGRQDDYEFENGMNYEFTISMYGSNDGVDVTVTAKSREFDWVCIEGITENTYTLTDLAEATQYEVKVKAVCGGDDGESDFTSSTKFTTGGDGINEAAESINVWNRANEIRVDLANDGNYTMNVVNILGQTVLTSDINGQGSHIVKHNLTSGVYVVTLSSADNTFSTKIVVR